MRAHVLTNLERKIIRQFLQNGEKPQGFRMLKKRILDYHKRIFEDSELVKKFIDALAK
jgi:hypothetical protein